ncbi:hypothetical protein J437_LFUL005079, partial [Ladona fulva]
TRIVSKSKSEKDFNCKDNLNKIGEGAVALQSKSRNSSCIDFNGKHSESSELEFSDKSRNCVNNHLPGSTDAKFTPSIKGKTSTVEGKAQEGVVTCKNFSDEKINGERNGIVISKSPPDKVTAKDIREANFKKDGHRATAVYNHMNVSRCSTWGLLSDDPKTQIVNYDLCTQQKKLPTDTFT